MICRCCDWRRLLLLLDGTQENKAKFLCAENSGG